MGRRLISGRLSLSRMGKWFSERGERGKGQGATRLRLGYRKLRARPRLFLFSGTLGFFRVSVSCSLSDASVGWVGFDIVFILLPPGPDDRGLL